LLDGGVRSPHWPLHWLGGGVRSLRSTHETKRHCETRLGKYTAKWLTGWEGERKCTCSLNPGMFE
jgi:hypothetical protein